MPRPAPLGSGILRVQFTWRSVDRAAIDVQGFIARSELCQVSWTQLRTPLSSNTDLRRGGVSTFIIPAAMPGVSLPPFKNKCGFRPMSTGELVLDEGGVCPGALIGSAGQGFRMATTAEGRGCPAVALRPDTPVKTRLKVRYLQ